jgi:uridine phosphorylase
MIPLPADLNRLSRLFQERGRLIFKNMFMRLYQEEEQKDLVTLAGPFQGAPQAVMILEKLIALGAKRVILFGWTGSLDPTLQPGDLILADKALSEEGTSRHYSTDLRPKASLSLMEELKASLEGEGMFFKQGPVWTTDAPYRETAEKVKRFQAEGVLGVDMETSALYTVGAFRGIEVAALLVVSDDLSQLKWRHGFQEARFLEARKKLAQFFYRFAHPFPFKKFTAQ